MIEILERHMVGGQLHEHIAEVKYKDTDGMIKMMSRATAVAWLDRSDANTAIVRSRTTPSDFVYVGTVHPKYSDPYIRTYANQKWTDNLLSLPEY